MLEPRRLDDVAVCMALPYLASLGGMIAALAVAVALAAAMTGAPLN